MATYLTFSSRNKLHICLNWNQHVESFCGVEIPHTLCAALPSALHVRKVCQDCLDLYRGNSYVSMYSVRIINVSRTYCEIISSGYYSYSKFLEQGWSGVCTQRVNKLHRAEIVIYPTVIGGHYAGPWSI